MQRRSLLTFATTAVAVLAGAAPALGAGPGATFLTGALPLPAGAVAGGTGGYGGDAADRSSVSADGRYVAFVAAADLLDPAANPSRINVFRKDRLTGDVVLVSRANGAAGAVADQSGSEPVISGDGSRVAWLTQAALDPSDSDGGAFDVYVRDIPSGSTILATPGTTSPVTGFDLSADGRYVAFATSEALDAVNDTNATTDVYRRDLTLASTVLVSRKAGLAAAGNAGSYEPSISADGRWVAFTSDATDLTSPATGGRQAFARDMTTSTTYLVSVQSGSSTVGANGSASEPAIAGQPTASTASVFVAYTSASTNGAVGDTDTQASVYRRQLSTNTPVLVSVSDGGVNANSRAHTPSISDDGTRVVFSSDATNLGAGAHYYGTYLRNLATSDTALLSTDNEYAVQGAISGDGSYGTWFNANGVTADSDPDLGGVFGRTYTAPATFGPAQAISHPAGSAPFLAPAVDMGSPDEQARTMSADGRYIVFEGYTSHLPGGTTAVGQIYRRDTLTGDTVLISRANGANGAPADTYGYSPSISADGNRVAFVSFAHLDPSHVDSSGQIYVRDVAAGTTTLVSRADGAGGALANVSASTPSISADGDHVVFVSSATNLGAPGPYLHAYERDLANGRTVLIDRAAGLAGATGDDSVDGAALPSADGRLVVFGTRANNLDPSDSVGTEEDVYVRDTVDGTTTLVSRRSGLAGAKAVDGASDPAISADGRTVAFRTDDQTLAPEAGAWGGMNEIVARTLATGANALVSRGPGGGGAANVDATEPSLSDDGSVIAFASRATNLLAGLGGGNRVAVFARTMATGALAGPPAFGLTANEPQDFALYPTISGDGQCLGFFAQGHNAISGLAGDFFTSYTYVVSGVCPKPLPTSGGGGGGTAKPAITKASLTHKRFRVGPKATAKLAGASASAAAKRKARKKPATPVGTTFRFTLSVRAKVTIFLDRVLPGRKAGKRCVTPTRKLRRKKACTRYQSAGSLGRHGLAAGRRSVAFSGRLGKHALAPGTYRATLRAGNSAGSSKDVKLTFVVVRR